MSAGTALERVLDALTSHGSTPRRSGGGWSARCPAHDDRNPSLSISNGDGRVLLHCQAGCHIDVVVAALQLTLADLFDEPKTSSSKPTPVDSYHYFDEHGSLLYQVVRFQPKAFRQCRPDGKGGWIWNLQGTRRVLYRLPAVIEAVKNGDTIYIVEGEKDVQELEVLLNAEERNGAVTCNPGGAGKWRPEYTDTLRGAADVVIIADRDEAGYAHAQAVATELSDVVNELRIVQAPVGKDAFDHVTRGRGLDDFVPLGPDPNTPPTQPVTLDQCHAVFQRWLGEEYDLDALDATLATAAAERLGGDPLWLLLVSGSGNAKTETVQPLAGAGAHVVSTIASDGALLSGTAKNQRAKDATGGLLRKIGDRGLLVIKDVTSILSMDRNARQAVLAAIREIHDGHWVRYLGVDGGRTLDWTGRITIIGAVTTAWDRAHDVIASMGDRFLILRMDSTEGRVGAGRQSRRNVDHEEQMRAELTAAMAGVLASADTEGIELTDEEGERLLVAADLVTLARTGVDYDYKGDVIDAHAPEMPTRFMKQLVQVVRGAVAVGMDRPQALRLAIRCARDSMPPLRLALLDDVAKHPHSTPTEVRRRLDKPRSTVDRQLQSLHILGVVRLDEEETEEKKTIWRYSLATGIDPATLRPSPDLLPHPHRDTKKENREARYNDSHHTPGNKSGDASLQVSDLSGRLDCGYPLDVHAGPGCLHPVIHTPADPWSST